MPECNRCGRDMPEDGFVQAWGRCRECVQNSYRQALSSYVLMMSEQVVETPYGWCTARCLDGTPVDWLCWHIHGTKADAEVCMAQTLTEGRGVFPIR
jgi:hypothetical protein